MLQTLVSKCGQTLTLQKIVDEGYCGSYCYRVCNEKQGWVAEIHRTYASLETAKYAVVPVQISAVHVQFETVESAFAHIAGVY